MKKEILELCHKIIILNGEVSQADCSYIKCENCPFSEQINGIHISCNDLLPYHALDIARYYIAEHETKEQNIKSVIDNVTNSPTRPQYYHRGSIDVIRFCIENDLDFLQGNIVKYITRYKEKNGIEDLNKALEYLNRIIERELNNNE